MPELPEVEYARKIVQHVAKDHKIRRIECAEDSIVIPDFKQIPTTFQGRTVLSVNRKGKYLWMVMKSGPSLLCHLGMTGTVSTPLRAPLLLETGTKNDMWPPSFLKLHMEFENGNELAFTSARRFSRILIKKNPENEEPISKLGFDPLLELPSPKNFQSLFETRRGNIKGLLLNQSFSAGVGNWIADEVLYQARINPKRNVTTLSPSEIQTIRRSLKRVIEKAVAVDAHKARFPKSWLFHKRWNKGKEKSFMENNEISFVKIAGRTTAWVPAIQK